MLNLDSIPSTPSRQEALVVHHFPVHPTKKYICHKMPILQMNLKHFTAFTPQSIALASLYKKTV